MDLVQTWVPLDMQLEYLDAGEGHMLSSHLFTFFFFVTMKTVFLSVDRQKLCSSFHTDHTAHFVTHTGLGASKIFFRQTIIGTWTRF